MIRSAVSARAAGGVALALTGMLVLLIQAGAVHGWGMAWPFFIIMPGVLCLTLALMGGRALSWLAIPGSVTAATGSILLWQATTWYYQSWAYAWTLLLAALGLGLAVQGIAGGRSDLARMGTRLGGAGLALFALAWPLYELGLKHIVPVTAADWPNLGIAWPYYVLIPGLGLVAAMTVRGRRAAPLAVPAAIITVVGLILLYQYNTASYLSWTYAWALIPAAAGLGLSLQGRWSNRLPVARAGMRLAEISVVTYLLFATFFGTVLGFGTVGTRLYWPVLLVVAGAAAIWSRSSRALW